ncbi:hypothetical protein CHS0354_038078 [Potamilus streckersoni]|uniref:ARM repeat superfamily protein n=1 Tax=Potamilus streckersoni TaxID=2493646 RepID=A0AAE0W1T3_9BIVA|nr:hypothetical protein CHS0354_038078 [Potamilus streckersoni]
MDNVMSLLCSSVKLERDRGFTDLQNLLINSNDDFIRQCENLFSQMLADTSLKWESKHGALMGAKGVLETKYSEDFTLTLRERALHLADDAEFRVRIAAGEVLGLLCRKLGPEVYVQSKTVILEGIHSNLERDPMTESGSSEQEGTDKLFEKLSSSPSGERRNSADAAQIFHDTAGWKSLETWMKCLQCVIEGCGHLFNSFVDQELLDLIFRALTHTNRFVRETGYYVCSVLVTCGVIQDGSGQMLLQEENAIFRYGHQFSEHLGKGLADNWSQVRLASSVATRNFLQSLPSEEARQQFYSVLLPRMCLNRYYVAEGVRIYSQDSWKLVTSGEGKAYVEQYIQQVVDYYVEATGADNHAVREAACACIAELGAKVSKAAVHKYIPTLLEALLICFNDDSWPVRDAACIACGNFVVCFPDESRTSIPALYPLFFKNLQDSIPSVRQGAALALSNVVKAYSDESFALIVKKIKDGLDGVKDQSANAEKYSSLDKAPATYGVVKKLHDNDMELHTDRQMYSCGSLAPKMGRGSFGGGCMDHKFQKPSEPWELADGCINLVAEMSSQQKYAQKVSELLPLVSKAASFDHYTQHVILKETLCNRLPHIGMALGKRFFNPQLELFFDAIFDSLVCDNALTSAAANNCITELSKLLGPSILRGRLEQFNPRYVELLDQFAHQGPAITGGCFPPSSEFRIPTNLPT